MTDPFGPLNCSMRWVLSFPLEQQPADIKEFTSNPRVGKWQMYNLKPPNRPPKLKHFWPLYTGQLSSVMTLGFQEMVISFGQGCGRSYPTLHPPQEARGRVGSTPKKGVSSKWCRRKDIQVRLQDWGKRKSACLCKYAKRTSAFQVLESGAELVGKESKVPWWKSHLSQQTHT